MQYREATQLREQNPDMARAEIARRVDRPAGAVRGWLVENKVPRVVSGIQTAREHGWINVNSESERFRSLNQLVAWIFSGGGISVDRYTPHFSVDDPLMLAVLSQHFRWLQLDYRRRHPENPEHHLEVVPAEGSAILGRILSILGAPRGVKAQLDNISLPGYLSTVDDEHRRDFIRIYLLNRTTDPEQAGSYIQSVPSETYAHELCDLIESVTPCSATVGHQHRVWVPAEAVHSLAGGANMNIRSGLATAAVYGSLSPPTERAFASTYRRTETPGGYRYHQCYQAALAQEDSKATLAADLGIPESTIQSWRRGSRPYATNSLEQAREHGWLSSKVESETTTSMIALLTWLLAHGALRETYYPIFRSNTDTQQERFASIAETIGLSYNIVHQDDDYRSTEIRPAVGGSLLGRILYVLGAPRRSEPQTTAVLPPLAYHYPRHAKQVADIWCLHYAKMSTSEDISFTLTIPRRTGEQFSDALATLLSDRLNWTISQSTPREIVVSDYPEDTSVPISSYIQ
ncbi:hypothetical protein ACOZ4L_16610 (plasmid) [Haloplanus ruber]|uniref:XRE family transcriptional regulator n=1 Tax=Haloplanus ruber TaxID=869892 RepID=A0ABD6D2F9_9EURY|nr:hypothetical protein [Haloplanus ruber]